MEPIGKVKLVNSVGLLIDRKCHVLCVFVGLCLDRSF